ncbi:NADPH-dependent FMN reductase [Aerococcus vaginalis]
MKFGVIVGSLHKNSSSEGVAKGIVAGLPEDAEVEFIDIDMPLYNQDFDEQDIPEYNKFRETVAAQDAIIFVTPEHNRMISAAMKNALDVGSRPLGQNVWDGKPALIVSQSSGAMGGMAANHAVRQALVFLNMQPMQQPELYVNSSNALNEDGTVNEGSVEYLNNAAHAFYDFAKKIVG